MPSKRKSSEHTRAKKSNSRKAKERGKRPLKSRHPSAAYKNRSRKVAAAPTAARTATSKTDRRGPGETDEKYRVLFNQSRDGIALIDLKTGLIVDCNKQFENLSGRDLRQLKKTDIWKLRPPAKVKTAKKKFLEIKKSGWGGSAELEFQKPDGEIIPVEFVSRVVKIQGKKLILSAVRDITPRKRAEAALQKLTQDLGERVKELNCLYGIAGLIEKPGIPLEEILQGTVDLIPPAWRHAEITCARVVLEKKVFSSRKFRQTAWKQSSDIRAHERLVGALEVYYLEKRPESHEGPFLREERNLIDAIAERLGRVIERRKTEKALEQSERKYREFVDSLPQIAFEVDRKGNLTFINRRALENYGYSEEDFDKGLNVSQLVIPEDRGRLKSAIAIRLRGESSTRDEYTALRKDGTRFPIVVHSRPIVRENKVLGLRGIAVDITERKEAERALQESEKKYRTLVEQSLQGIVVIQDFRVLFANTAVTQICGYTVEELLSLSQERIRSLVHPGDRDLVWGRLADRLAGRPVPRRYECRIIPKDGASRWVEMFSTLIQYGGKPAVQAVLVDITERRETEQALEQTNKRMEALLDHTHMMVAYLDPQFNFIKVNRAYARADERDPAFFPGKNHFDLYPHKENKEIFRRVVETGKPYFASGKPFEYAEHPERGVTYWDWGLVPIKDPEGSVTGLVLTVLNVTERKRAEDSLRESEERFHRVAQTASDAILTVDSRGSIVFWNLAAEAMFGYSADEAVNKPLTMIMPERFHKAYKKRMEQSPSAGEARIIGRIVEMYGLRKNGREFPLELSIATWKTGEETFFTGIVRDITERKRAEENIKQQKEFLNNIIESLTYPFYVLDANDYTIKMANSAAGLKSPSESTTCYALTHRSKRPCQGTEHPCPIEEVKRARKLVTVEHIHYDEEGNGRNIEVHANPIFDNEGNVVQVIEYCLDTTERRRAEEALRESEEKFRTLAEQSPNMIFINRKGRVVYANKKCEDIVGYKRAEFYSPDFDFFTLIAPESREKIRANFSQHMKAQEVPPCEYTIISRSGKKVEAILATKLMRYQGENAILGTVTDITERKRIEEEIRKLNRSLELRARELAAANKELEAFSYSVSHDLRAPLRAIDGFSRALLEDYGDKLDQPGKDYLRRVRAATEHMGQLIDDLLKLSVMIRREIKREEIDFSEVVRSVATGLQKAEPDRQVEFLIQEGVLGHGDPSLLRAVLENLVGNAWKFTSKHSQARIEFGTVQNKGQTVYFVRDDGAGFDMTYAAKLFLPFQRLHSSAEFSGNGIGLTLTDRIINRHGGRIWAEGEVEKGATFYFTLP
jgi:PAS domain S-box-containing protein